MAKYEKFRDSEVTEEKKIEIPEVVEEPKKEEEKKPVKKPARSVGTAKVW